ncbi:MAG: hypothetical protein C4542_07335 [Dehalococcoidia bacterium]|nr:MAG: hypothetical protein C4542_07335 [Dehalococcoidia bacterium]
MRLFAIILNFLLLGIVGYLFIKHGPPKDNSGDALLVIFIIMVPLWNLIAHFGVKAPDNLLTLYIRRKILEEKRKIKQLSEEKK